MKPRPFLAILTAAFCVVPLAAQPAPKPPPLPDGAVARLGESHFFHPTSVMALDFSPDGASIVTGTQDGTMFLWDVAGGFERARWRQDMNNNVVTVRYSPNGRMIASTSSSGSLFVWTADGKQVYSRPNQRYEPLHFAWMPDNQRLVTAGRTGAVTFHDVVAGRELSTMNTAMPNIVAIALAPDGKRFALRDQSGKMKGFEIDGAKSIVTFDDGTVGSRYMRPNALFRFAPDNTTLMTEATGGTSMGPTLWDATTGKVIRRIDSAVSGYMWTATANGRFLAASTPGDGRLRVIGVTSGLEVRAIDGTAPITQGLAFSPDGKRLAAIVGGQALRVWDMDSGEPMHQNTGHGAAVTALAFLKDGRLVSTGGDRTVRAWDVRAGKEIERDTIQTYLYGMVPEPDGAGVLMTAGTILHRWRPGEGLTTGATLPTNMGGNSALAPDASAVVISTGQQLHVFSLPEAREIKKLDIPLNSHVQNFALSPGGRYLSYVEGSNFGAVHLYDLKRDRARKPLIGDAANTLYSERLLFSPDGRFYASIATNRPTMIWETGTGLVRAILPRGDDRQAGTFSSAFSPDGRLLALGLQSGALYLFDLRTGQSTPVFSAGPIETPQPRFSESPTRSYSHRAGVSHLAFSHDGSLLASGGQDQSILVWDVRKLLAKLPPSPPVTAPTAAQVDAWWHSLASTEGKAVSEAVWSLADAPAKSLELFEAKLKPAPGPDPAAMAKWVVELSDAKFTVREQAQRRLAAAGATAYTALVDGLRANPPAEARTRLTRLIDAIDSQYSPERLRPLRALEVLEKIATPAARTQVERLATSTTDPDLKDEAQRVLERWRK